MTLAQLFRSISFPSEHGWPAGHSPGRSSGRNSVRGIFKPPISTDDDARSDLLLDNPDIDRPSGLPAGRGADLIRNASRGHFFTPRALSHPTVAGILATGHLQPPAAVELFLATAGLYRATRQACRGSAPTHRIRTESYYLTPKDILHVLLLMNECFGGKLGMVMPPTSQYVALIEIRRGLAALPPARRGPLPQQGYAAPLCGR